MRRSRITVAAIAIVIAAGGGIAYAATTGSSSGSAYGSSASAATAPSQPNPTGQPTIRVAIAKVQGKSERILVDAAGMPLYTYRGDTATTSHVSGQLATLWPPLVSANPTERGTNAALSLRTTGNGQQVTYQGHFLYTFVEDQPGRVTGQGVQDFFVATPGAAVQATPSRATSANTTPGYGY